MPKLSSAPNVFSLLLGGVGALILVLSYIYSPTVFSDGPLAYVDWLTILRMTSPGQYYHLLGFSYIIAGIAVALRGWEWQWSFETRWAAILLCQVVGGVLLLQLTGGAPARPPGKFAGDVPGQVAFSVGLFPVVYGVVDRSNALFETHLYWKVIGLSTTPYVLWAVATPASRVPLYSLQASGYLLSIPLFLILNVFWSLPAFGVGWVLDRRLTERE